MTARNIVDDIYGYSNELGQWGEDSGNVALQVEDDGEAFHLFTGEAHYEGERAGRWGNVEVPGGASYEECYSLARKLIDDALADSSAWE